MAVLERGWLGGGNMGRNTTIIRSNYLWDESAAIYEHSLKLWEGLAEELDYDLLFSQRGVLNLAHSAARRARGRAARERQPAQRRRRRVAGRRTGSPEFCPIVNISPECATRCSARRCSGAAASPATTTSRGRYARAADARGVDLIQDCEVTGIRPPTGASSGVETTRGAIGRRRVALSAAGHTTVLAGDGGPAPAAPEPSAAGAGLGAARAGAQLRRDVERRARLRQPGAQGRAGDGRRRRRLQLATRSAAASTSSRRRWRRRSSCSRSSRRRTCCAPGPASSTSRPTRRRSSG